MLFDEIEKAHPRMHSLLLSVLEEGELTDGKGQRVCFDRSIVVMTSNAGAIEVSAASNALGFERSPALGRDGLRSITSEALGRRFTPEFLGRIDETIVFDELGPREAERIAQRKLFELARRARQRGLRVAFTPGVARWVARRGFSTEFGARDLLRVVRNEIEPRLSALLLDESVRADQIVRAGIRRGELHFGVED